MTGSQMEHLARGHDGAQVATPMTGFLAGIHRPVDPLFWSYYFNDFNELPGVSETDNTAAWLKTSIDTDVDGADVVTIANGHRGGALLITTNDNAADNESLQHLGESWDLAAGKKLWYETRMKVGQLTDSNIIVGLCIEDTGLYAGMTDGVYFNIDHDANIDFVSEIATVAETNVVADDAADLTWVTLGFYWDGIATVTPWVDRVEIVTGREVRADITAEELTLSMEIDNQAAAVGALYVDYILCVQEK